MKRMTTGIVLLSLLLHSTGPEASQPAWVMSIPHALSAERIYKVRILEIDGVAQKDQLRYRVSPGRHDLVVELMLDLEWEPDLQETPNQLPIKQMVLEVDQGGQYQLGGRVDIGAPIEAQLDGSYWQPFLYRVIR